MRKSRATGRPKGRPKTHDWERIVALYATHESMSHVARLMGVDRTSIMYALRRMGVATSGKAKRMRRWEKKLAAQEFIKRCGDHEKAREQYLIAAKQAKSQRIERMMSLAAPKRKRLVA